MGRSGDGAAARWGRCWARQGAIWEGCTLVLCRTFPSRPRLRVRRYKLCRKPGFPAHPRSQTSTLRTVKVSSPTTLYFHPHPRHQRPHTHSPTLRRSGIPIQSPTPLLIANSNTASPCHVFPGFLQLRISPLTGSKNRMRLLTQKYLLF